jgi:hypothetical protein
VRASLGDGAGPRPANPAYLTGALLGARGSG